ncbi:hypothetical protein MRB53_018843 [Persea americana]|uniref:Uncharacterized protein n=1 Tax=Persea americana TaxID=3435 RepID=A0ACC2M9Z5_PERAE|nr:hypothetical protein MRB53_018843 [Persea americana]
MIRSSSTPIMASLHKAAGRMEKSLKASPAGKTRPNIHIPEDARQAMLVRRTRSEDNLNTGALTEEASPDSPVKFRANHTSQNKLQAVAKLETTPSFSLYRRGEDEQYDSDNDYENLCNEEEFGFPEPSDTSVKGSDIGRFRLFCNILNGAVYGHRSWENPSAMYMATGLGIGGTAAYTQVNNIEDEQMEKHLEKLARENPCNSLILKNYAQYLFETKQDYKKADEYYSRAILAEPSDGEVLSEYARLRWESSRDEVAASRYFELAIQHSPENSHVLGAYASFLWETDSREQKQDNPEVCQTCNVNPDYWLLIHPCNI